MRTTTKAGIMFLVVVSCVIAVLGVALRPHWSRRSAYHSISALIAQGDEAGAIREVEHLSSNGWFHPDWTPASAMPSWRWVHEWDFRLFGCPTCRGGWQTLLHSAAQHGQPRLVATLIRSGASINYQGDRGSLPLMAAAIKGHTNVVLLLLANGVDLNTTNFYGSALHAAVAFGGSPEAVEFLLEAGAKPNLTDHRGWTALDCARVWNRGAEAILLAHGAVASTNRRVALPAGVNERKTPQN